MCCVLAVQLCGLCYYRFVVGGNTLNIMGVYFLVFGAWFLIEVVLQSLEACANVLVLVTVYVHVSLCNIILIGFFEVHVSTSYERFSLPGVCAMSQCHHYKEGWQFVSAMFDGEPKAEGNSGTAGL